MSIYYRKLKTIWDELSVYDPILECSCGQLKVRVDRHQSDCVIKFLMGLNEAYDNTRAQVTMLDPLPPVNKVFSYIQQQEKQRQITTTTVNNESIAMATRRGYGDNRSSAYGRSNFTGKKDRTYCTHCKIPGHSLDKCFKVGNTEPPICTHCNMIGHPMEKCFKLYGYPPNHKLYRGQRRDESFANQSSLVEEDNEKPVFLTKGEYQEFIALLRSKDDSQTNHSVNHVKTIDHSKINPQTDLSVNTTCLSVLYLHHIRTILTFQGSLILAQQII